VITWRSNFQSARHTAHCHCQISVVVVVVLPAAGCMSAQQHLCAETKPNRKKSSTMKN
jgi:hypothetical protein